MVTVVNNPPSENSSNGMGMMVMVLVLVLLGAAFYMYGLPVLKNMGGTQIVVPDKIDVNINQQPAQ